MDKDLDWFEAHERIPEDYGPPERTNGPEAWDDFEDLEVQRLIESEPDTPL
jgi:hypothetical protein